MTQRTLVPTMLDEAVALQQHMTEFQAYKAGLFEGNTDLLTAVADCATCIINLIGELQKVRQKGD